VAREVEIPKNLDPNAPPTPGPEGQYLKAEFENGTRLYYGKVADPDGVIDINVGTRAVDRDPTPTDGVIDYYDPAFTDPKYIDEFVEITGEEVEIDGEMIQVTKVKWNEFAEEYTGVKKIRIHAGVGHDQILVDSGVTAEVEIHGGSGNDLILTKGTAPARLWGDEGDDQIAGSFESDFIYGGSGNDFISAGENSDGFSGDDYIDGGPGDDTIEGLAGRDTILGREGNDTINGGKDVDLIYGHAGNDVLKGNEGDDWLEGGEGDDRIDGGEGADVLLGHAGNDLLNGGLGIDVMIGSTGNDRFEWVAGDELDSFVAGGGGTDTLAMITSDDDERVDIGAVEIADVKGEDRTQVTVSRPSGIDLSDTPEDDHPSETFTYVHPVDKGTWWMYRAGP